MSNAQIRELDKKIEAIHEDFKKPFKNDQERLSKTKELISLFDEQNELLNKEIDKNKALWKLQQLKN